MSKVCPILMAKDKKNVPIIFYDIDITSEQWKEIKKAGAASVHTGTEMPEIKPIYGNCLEEDCALWNEEKICCGLRK